MYSYFTLPRSISDSGSNKAERNPKFCDKLHLSSIHSSETIVEVVERSFQLPKFTEEELDSEIWKPIVGFPNYYISNLGRIYSTITNRIRKPKLSPLDKKRGNSCSITLCNGFGVSCHSYSSLMLNNFSDYSNDNEQRYYVIRKNNNPFDFRLSNLIITRNQNLKCYIGYNNRNNYKLHVSKNTSVVRYGIFRRNSAIDEYLGCTIIKPLFIDEEFVLLKDYDLSSMSRFYDWKGEHFHPFILSLSSSVDIVKFVQDNAVKFRTMVKNVETPNMYNENNNQY